MMLSVVFSLVAFRGKSQTTRQFGFAFLGLFSSLVAFVSVGYMGLVLLVSSAIVLPHVLFRLPEDRGTGKVTHLHSLVMILCAATVLATGMFMNLEQVHLELAILASIGILWITLKRSVREKAIGLAILSQVIFVAISLMKTSFWVVLTLEICRLLCSVCACVLGARR